MLLISFGTRPEYIKIKPLLDAFAGKLPYALLFTGQHTSLLKNVMWTPDIRQLNIRTGENRLDSIVESIMNNSRVFEDITSVMVQGDTTSAFAVALSAFHRKIDIIHLEAGLRTWDLKNPYPEEFNRQAISRMAKIHLCPTATSAENLRKENITNHVHIVGNTVLDNLLGIQPNYGNTILITMHRRENHDIMDKWFTEINNLAIAHPQYDFLLPLHPNPNVQKHRHLLKNVQVMHPLNHDDFIKILAECKFIITDSGGIQEEASFFRKKCIVCRKTTERTEGINVFSYLCASPQELKEFFYFMDSDNTYMPAPGSQCPYGDGTASQKILDLLAGIRDKKVND